MKSQLTHHDAEQVEMFREFLRDAGGPQGPYTTEQLEFRYRCFTERRWIAFLGVPEKEAKAAALRLRNQIAYRRRKAATDVTP